MCLFYRQVPRRVKQNLGKFLCKSLTLRDRSLKCTVPVHPGRLTWNLQITHLERKMIFQTSSNLHEDMFQPLIFRGVMYEYHHYHHGLYLGLSGRGATPNASGWWWCFVGCLRETQQMKLKQNEVVYAPCKKNMAPENTWCRSS